MYNNLMKIKMIGSFIRSGGTSSKILIKLTLQNFYCYNLIINEFGG